MPITANINEAKKSSRIATSGTRDRTARRFASQEEKGQWPLSEAERIGGSPAKCVEVEDAGEQRINGGVVPASIRDAVEIRTSNAVV